MAFAGFKVNIPNLLGAARLFSAPFVAVFALKGNFEAAFWVFILAGLTDAVDGPLARRFKTVDTLGFYLDPVADKILINTAYVTLGFLGLVPWWLAALVFLRDFLIAFTFAVSPLLKINLRVAPIPLSKTNTGLQIGLASLVIAEQAFAFDLSSVVEGFVWVVAATTLASAVNYVLKWARHGGEKTAA
jgi:cardiolipin synthase (CMP-forming)